MNHCGYKPHPSALARGLGQGGVSGRHFGHGARRSQRGHAQSAGRHEFSPACRRQQRRRGVKARSATPPAFFVADLRGEPGCQKLTFYPAGRTEKQQTPAPCRRSSSPCAEKIRPSCQAPNMPARFRASLGPKRPHSPAEAPPRPHTIALIASAKATSRSDTPPQSCVVSVISTRL